MAFACDNQSMGLSATSGVSTMQPDADQCACNLCSMTASAKTSVRHDGHAAACAQPGLTPQSCLLPDLDKGAVL